MKSLRVLALLVLLLSWALTCIGVVETYSTSQHSLFDRWSIPRLVIHLLRTTGFACVVGLGVARGSRATKFLQIPALLLVAVRFVFLLTLVPAYFAAIQRWGLSRQSVDVIADYTALLLCGAILSMDLLGRSAPERQRAAVERDA